MSHDWIRWRKWNSDLRWSRWHLQATNTRTICGTRIDSPSEERGQRRDEPPTGICQRCLALKPTRTSW